MGMRGKRGEADGRQLNGSYRAASSFTGVIPPHGLSSLDMLPHTEPLVAPVQAYEAQKVTLPSPLALSQGTGGWKGLYSTAVEHRVEIRRFFPTGN